MRVDRLLSGLRLLRCLLIALGLTALDGCRSSRSSGTDFTPPGWTDPVGVDPNRRAPVFASVGQSSLVLGPANV